MSKLDPQGYWNIIEFMIDDSVYAKLIQKYQLFSYENNKEQFDILKEVFRILRNGKRIFPRTIINIVETNGLGSREVIKHMTNIDLVGIIAENFEYIKPSYWQMLYILFIDDDCNFDILPSCFNLINKLAYERRQKIQFIPAMASFINACKTSIDDTKANSCDIPEALISNLHELTKFTKNKDYITFTVVEGYYSIKIADCSECFIILKIIHSPDSGQVGINETRGQYQASNNGKSILFCCSSGLLRIGKGVVKIIVKKIIPTDSTEYQLYPGCFQLEAC